MLCVVRILHQVEFNWEEGWVDYHSAQKSFLCIVYLAMTFKVPWSLKLQTKMKWNKNYCAVHFRITLTDLSLSISNFLVVSVFSLTLNNFLNRKENFPFFSLLWQQLQQRQPFIQTSSSVTLLQADQPTRGDKQGYLICF